MRLAIFDIDDTLTRASDQFDVCFVRAVAEVLGSTEIDERWSRYSHVTDSGIVNELFKRHHGRDPTPSENRRIQELYLRELDRDGGTTDPIPGAAEFLESLASHNGWSIAIATGNWKPAARWKLKTAGIPVDNIPMATADDAPERSLIIDLAIQRAGAGHNGTVYLGDGAWDRAAAAERGIAFVAVGDLDAPYRLRDFTQPEAALRLLERAGPT